MAKAYIVTTTDDDTNYEYGEQLVWADSPSQAKYNADFDIPYTELRAHRDSDLDDREDITNNDKVLYFINEQREYHNGFYWDYNGWHVSVDRPVNYDDIYIFIHGDHFYPNYFSTPLTEEDIDKFVEDYLKKEN